MNLWQYFIKPRTVSEALLALRDSPPPAIAIAGGTDLLLDLDQGRHAPATTLVDLTGIGEMNALDLRGAALFIGAAVPIACVARDPLVMRHASALVEACDLIGGPQVRNVATLGGNVAHALPAADGTIALVALDAQAEIASAQGIRRVPVEELFEGPGKLRLAIGHELIVGFHVPTIGPREASAFKRIMRPQGVALPILNLAVWVRRRGATLAGARIAVGPYGPIPRRARETERLLAGEVFEEALIDRATDELLAHALFRSSPRRASAAYRRSLVRGLLGSALQGAWDRSKA